MSLRWKLFALFCSALAFLLCVIPAVAGCNAIVVGTVAPTDPNGGPGTVQITASTAGTPAILARESRAERLSDVLIFDDTVGPGAGAGNCFVVGNTLRLTYNAALTLPASIASATSAFFDVYDSSGFSGLVVQASSTVGLSPGGAPQTVITLSVQQGDRKSVV